MCWPRRILLLLCLFSFTNQQTPCLDNVFINGFNLSAFTETLPIPSVIDGTTGNRITIDVLRASTKFHCSLPDTPIYGYDGKYPGPTISVRAGVTTTIQFRNYLTGPTILPSVVDDTDNGFLGLNRPDFRHVTHLHGGYNPPQEDGLPDEWIVPLQRQQVTFKNRQEPALLWYHDHSVGITRGQVYAGLAGLYIIRDPFKEAGLPSGEYEIPLVIQDKELNADGTLLYSGNPNRRLIVVNGKIWPITQVKKGKYRLRVLNASNFRFYNLTLVSATDTSDVVPFLQIGGDGGLMPKAVQRNSILIGPSERLDLIVDFTNLLGRYVLTNNAPVPFPGGGTPDPCFAGRVMMFEAITTTGRYFKIPSRFPIPSLPNRIDRKKSLVLSGVLRNGRFMLHINGKMWEDPLSDEDGDCICQGAVELWEIVNTTPLDHPIHIHQITFLLVNRQPFNLEIFANTSSVDEATAGFSIIEPEQYERGFKDTIDCPAGQVTRVKGKFDLLGFYPTHCHMLEHEDFDMMRPFKVVDPTVNPTCSCEGEER